ncbi:hypothetical protein QMK33_04990 [Hymenobacter sp. H14-R3]|uniref:hypothetical protein n=1 Tax=Hymenobacter sp. H14-R3 TaxID=3046308 RepID=UPI0024B9AB04|nr:hypothetical protein [Hymenobacter sp. H14-R3]MDJ0364498.1 hypothetical protein [Hymenobacter sp. H14-R3]
MTFYRFFLICTALAFFFTHPYQALGQQLDCLAGSLPGSQYDQYVEITNVGLSATHVQTRRMRQGKSEFVDIINVLADNIFFLRQEASFAGSGLNDPYVSDQLLVTMAVLPDPATGRVMWVPLDPDSLATQHTASLTAVLHDCYARLFAYKAALPYANALTRRLDLRPVIWRAGRRWTTRNMVLTEYFLVRRKPQWFIEGSDNVTLNYKARVFSRADLTALQRRVAVAFPKEEERPPVDGELQTKLLLERQDGLTYSFWSTQPQVTDLEPELVYSGVVELQFRPGIGMVSGKFPTYFHLNDISTANTFFEVVSLTHLPDN